MEPTRLQRIINRLWPDDIDPSLRCVYAVLDGARDQRIVPMISNSQLPHDCLYYPPLSNALYAAAPHIVELKPQAEFTRQLIEEGWGKSWGIFMITEGFVNLATVRHQCRKLNVVLGPKGERLLFRYYDPRIMRKYLPRCNHDEVNRVFGLVKEIIVEGKQNGVLHSFQHSGINSKAETYTV